MKLRTYLAVASVLACGFLASFARGFVDPRAEPNAAFKELVGAEKEVAKVKGDDKSFALQTLAWARSKVGDYMGALGAFREAFGGSSSGAQTDDQHIESTLKGYQAASALDAIAAAAKDRQIVILNEAHHLARDRVFAQLLAQRLHSMGFQYLACETLDSHIEGLQTRRYVSATDGFYTTEPLFADFVRQSLKLGYAPIAYESEDDEDSKLTEEESMNRREAGEARNLVDRVFKKDPKAKVFIYVGFSHILKKEQGRKSGKVTWMAGRLKAATGIDPLTIDQSTMTDPIPGSFERAVLDHIYSGKSDSESSVVLRSEKGPGFLVIGSYGNDADIQVFHRPTTLVNGRPDWLAMGGYRKPAQIPANLLPKKGRRLVQAFIDGEAGNPIAVDQVLVSAGTPPPVFMLPQARLRYAFEK